MNLDRATILARSQRFVSAIDSWSVCEFCFHTWTIYTLDDLVEIIRACTGWRYTTV